MDTMILNFKKKEIVADSKEEAIKFANTNLFRIDGDASQSFNKWKEKQVGGVTERDIKAFMLKYLAEKKNVPGIGYIITVNPAVIDTRERPYQFEDLKGNGKREYKSVYVWKDRETGQIVCKTDTNKAEAKLALKKMYREGKYKGVADLIKMKEVAKGNPIVATARYTPSKNTRKGTWIVFGIEA